MATTSNQGLPYPALSDAANGPVGIQNLALAVETKIVMTFANAGTRATVVTAPVEGMVSYLTDNNTLEVYNGLEWVPFGAGAWNSYTPNVTASSSPTLGTGGTRDGRYITAGKTVHVMGSWQFGTTGYSAGSGTYNFSLPVNASTNVALRTGGSAFVGNGASFWGGWISISTTSFQIYVPTSTTNPAAAVLTGAGPGGAAWAASSNIRWGFTYEAA
jgi:hypothetical protein